MKNTFLILIVISTINLLAQNAPQEEEFLHLIMAYDGRFSYYKDLMDRNPLKPEPERWTIADHDTSYFHRLLWRLGKDTLILVDTLGFAPQMSTRLGKIVHFNELKWLTYGEQQNTTIWNYTQDHLPRIRSILDYSSDTLILRRVDVSKQTKHYGSPSGIFQVDGKIVAQCGSEKVDGFNQRYAMDQFFNIYELSIEDMQNKYNFGFSSPFQNNFSTFFKFDKNGILKIPGLFYLDDKKYKLENAPESDLQMNMPFDFRVPLAGLYIIYNNPKSKYLVANPRLSKRVYPNSTFSNNELWIQNKATNEWNKIKLLLTGRIPIFSGYKNWLYGANREDRNYRRFSPYYRNIDSCRVSIDSFYQAEKIDRNRYSKSNKYGIESPLFSIFSRILYLYHIPSEKLITWNTHDLDSELIVIEDNWIYYRVFDELRRVPLDEDLKEIVWDREELLIKNEEIIPHVHNIFWHKKSEIKIEWLTPKPDFAK